MFLWIIDAFTVFLNACIWSYSYSWLDTMNINIKVSCTKKRLSHRYLKELNLKEPLLSQEIKLTIQGNWQEIRIFCSYIVKNHTYAYCGISEKYIYWQLVFYNPPLQYSFLLRNLKEPLLLQLALQSLVSRRQWNEHSNNKVTLELLKNSRRKVLTRIDLDFLVSWNSLFFHFPFLW